MSGLAHRWSRWEREWEAQMRWIDRQMDQGRREWTGEGRRGLEEAHEQLKETVHAMEREAGELERLLRRVEVSIETAERLMAEQARQAMQTKSWGGR